MSISICGPVGTLAPPAARGWPGTKRVSSSTSIASCLFLMYLSVHLAASQLSDSEEEHEDLEDEEHDTDEEATEHSEPDEEVTHRR